MLVGIILLCAIVAVAIVIYISYTIKRFAAAPIETTYKQIRPQLVTGDIIMFSCHWHTSRFNQIFYALRTKFLGSEYGHVGMVYKTDSGRLYLLEGVAAGHVAKEKGYYLNRIQNEDREGQGGIRLIDLDTIMHDYHLGHAHTMKDSHRGGGATFALIPCTDPVPNELIQEQLHNYTHKIFESFRIVSYLAVIDIYLGRRSAISALRRLEKANGERAKRITCSEFLIDLLHRCGRINIAIEPSQTKYRFERIYPAKLFWPSRFVDGTFHRISSVKYGPPIKYIYTGV